MNIEVKKLIPEAVLPTYANEHDAGMDLYASKTVTIPAHERALIPTGIAMAIPEGNVGLIWDKSGLATKHGLTCLAGVIDAGYRGEVIVAVYNTSNKEYIAEAGKKIAQLLVQPVVHGNITEVKELSDSMRGEKGFGSSGV